MNRPLIILTGPTASGKTSLGIRLAQYLHSPIVSADSRMVYRGLDIGTGKPTWEYRYLLSPPWIVPSESPFGLVYQIQEVDHYGLDLVEPGQPFSLADWLNWVRSLIDHCWANGRVPLVVGGTNLYLKALSEGYVIPPVNAVLRHEIAQLAIDAVYRALCRLDPITAAREQKNPRRLRRALEVVRLTGRPIAHRLKVNPPDSLVLLVDRPRQDLYAAINQRLGERLKAGLLEEVTALIQQQGVDPIWLQSLGLEYRAIVDYQQGLIGSDSDLETHLQGKIHAFARRQLSWWRHYPSVHRVSGYTELEQQARDWLQRTGVTLASHS
ncbi:tRNA dimethylallyltransferase [Candidatus Berkelbacteria bacterium]|nr:tRNA dimethylallyltransferase [Candidatus Berkelbacteria bacterium]